LIFPEALLFLGLFAIWHVADKTEIFKSIGHISQPGPNCLEIPMIKAQNMRSLAS
jgi:hypothetical protein